MLLQLHQVFQSTSVKYISIYLAHIKGQGDSGETDLIGFLLRTDHGDQTTEGIVGNEESDQTLGMLRH